MSNAPVQAPAGVKLDEIVAHNARYLANCLDELDVWMDLNDDRLFNLEKTVSDLSKATKSSKLPLVLGVAVGVFVGIQFTKAYYTPTNKSEEK